MSLKIIKLQAENFKRLKAVEIKPTGEVVMLTGKNGEGKSSVLDSIMAALAGEKKLPKEPIRKGEKKAKICVDLGEFKVERTCTQKSSYLTVTSKDGLKYTSPQQMLDKLVGSLSFDPLDFVHMDNKQQVSILKDLIGLDFTEADNKREDIYDDRTMLNRQAKALKAQVDSYKMPEDLPDDEIVISELTIKHQEILKVNKENEDKRKELGKMHADYEDLTFKRDNIQLKMEELQNELNVIHNEIALKKEEGNKFSAEVKKLKDADPAEIIKQIEEAESKNVNIRASAENKKLKENLDKLEKDIDSKSNEITKIDGDKQQKLAEAKMPIAGLSFDNDTVKYNDIPFAQISSAEQLKVSLSMGLALNPKIRVILIRDGSLLDKDNLKAVQEMAVKFDAQVWLEKVDDTGEMGIVIEDGMVKEKNG